MSNEGEKRADQAQRRRLVDLIDYVAHLARLGDKPIMALGDYRRLVYHEAALADRTGIELDQTDKSGPVWMSIERLKPTGPPPVPELLAPWLTVADDPDAEPSLASTVRGTMPEAEAKSLVARGVVEKADARPAPASDDAGSTAGKLYQITFRRKNLPEIQEAADAYLKDAWRPWAEAERILRGTIGIYDDFFSLLQSVQTLDGADGVEVVWGIGMARWRAPGGAVDHPIIEQLVDIDLDAETGRIKLRPRSSEPQISLKPFFALDVAGADQVLTIAKEYLDELAPEKEITPFERGSFEPLLRQVASRMDAHGRYLGRRKSGSAKRPPPLDDTLCVTDGWVVFARQRSEDFFVHDLEGLKLAVEQAESLPGPALRLVTEPSGRRTYTSSLVDLAKATFGRAKPPRPAEDEAGEDEAEETEFLFPKPFNEDQMSIVRRLDRSDGVVVQGPPGTGKTHTIANIICHYLATGRRVLVTSKGEAALTVLREHIPEGIRDLTISLLTNENEGLQQLEQAVSILAEMATGANPHELERSIHADQARIIELREKMAEIDRELIERAARHLTPVADGLAEGGADGAAEGLLPIEFARRVTASRDEYDWLPDRPDPAAPFDPTFTDADIAALRAARVAAGARLSSLGRRLPDPDDLPDATAMTTIHDDLVNANKLGKKVRDRGAAVAMTSEDAIDRVAALLDRVEKVAALLRGLEAEPWLHVIFDVWRQHGLDAKQTALFNDMLPAMSALTERRRALIPYATMLPDEADTDPRLYDAVRRAARSGKPLGLFTGGKAELQSLLGGIQIEGRAPRDAADWKKVLETMDWRAEMAALISRWNMVGAQYDLAPLDTDITRSGRRLDVIVDLVDRSIAALGPERAEIDREIAEIAPHIMSAAEMLASRDNAEQAADALRLNLSASRFASSRERLDRIAECLADRDGPISEAMSAFVAKWVGNGRYDRGAIAERWQAMYQELVSVAEAADALETIERVTGAIRDSGAPKWAAILASEPVAEGHEDRWTPETWRAAWDGRRREARLREIDARERIAALSAMRVAHEDEIREAFHRVVENRTFLGLRQAVTEEIESALTGFAAAIRRVGKGTGVRARRFRRDARAAMEKCYAAVPCWIMPTWRVSETLPAELGSFDLVVVDEASQSDIGALPALLRGAKLLIVGDDKQVSPTGAFLEESRLLQLERNFLSDQPFASMMLPGNSLYELANSVFPGRRIMLREHFRCVEPIIRFSDQFYNEPIVALRIPTASERLDPPLIDVFVANGRKDRHQVNAAEADGIVDEIARIVADPALAGRSIGAVSLIGTRQTDYIQRRLLERIGEAAYVAHDITCGNAAVFQGKERDIMFVSMVECPGSSSAKTALLWEQRFNVAFSRARDRMYLYRSVEEEGLSPGDLKAKAIHHFKQPMEAPAGTADPMALCDTDFEREIFGALRSKGYWVVPKVKVSSHAIDLVVEGAGDRRLAISLDGDRAQTPEDWAAELARQRTLERLGWRFWRCWGSSYYADPEACLADLKRALEAMEIEPRPGEVPVRAYTEHRVIGGIIAPRESGRQPGHPRTARDEKEVGEIGARAAPANDADAIDDMIEPGDRVLIAFPDDSGRPRTLTLGDGDDPARNWTDPTALAALVGKSIDEQVELDVDDARHLATIVGIEKARAAS